METLVIALAIVVGIAGTLLPILPGIVLVWAATLLWGIIEGFGVVGWIAFGLITGLGLTGLYLGVRVPQKSAAGTGIGLRGQLLALAFAVVGFFVVPIVGAAVGFVLGVYVASFLRDRTTAWASTKTTIRSLFLASGIQFGAAVAMGLVWVGWALAV
ncbi:MAG: DUF456 domain-containing protein [Acidimicrobiia bacterium]